MAEEPRISSLAVLARNAAPGNQESEEEAEDQTPPGTERALIIDRQHAATFPNVLPNSQESVAENDAADIVATSKQIGAVRIQSYMDAAYGAFRSAAGAIPENEDCCRDRWARDHYYTHLREYQNEMDSLHAVPVF